MWCPYPPPPFCQERGRCAPGAGPSPGARGGRAPPRGSATAPPACAAAVPAAGPGGLPGEPELFVGQGDAQPRRCHHSASAELRGQRGFAFPVEGKRRKNALFPPLPLADEAADKTRGGRAGGTRGTAEVAPGEEMGFTEGMRGHPAPPVNSGTKSGPGGVGSIWALMVK